jgi:TPR repeat protein
VQCPMSPGRTTDWEQLAKELFPESEPDTDRSAGAHTPTGRQVAIRSDDHEPLPSGKSPSVAKWMAFGALYAVAVASASIAGFSIVRGGRDAEPIVVTIPSDIPGRTEVAAIPGSSAARSEGVAEALKPTQQVVNAGAAHEPKSPQAAEPISAVSDPPQGVNAEVRANVSAGRPEAEVSEKSDAGQRDAIEQLNPAAAASPEPDDESTPWVAQSPSVAREEAAGTAPHSGTGQPDVGELLEATRAAAFDPPVLREEPSTIPTRRAETAYNSEAAERHASEPVEVAMPAPATAEDVKAGPQSPNLGSTAASETEHRLEEPHPGVAGAANLREAARAMQPDVVPPPASDTTVAAPAPLAIEAAPEDERFKNAEADALLARGDALFATGDLTSARLFYEHAVAAGNAAAALRLGSTFDPAFLARAHVGRVQGDLPTALYWYRRARDLGNADAETLLRGVENTMR